MSCPVHIAEGFHSSAPEFARGLRDSIFQLINPVSAPMCKHTTSSESEQGSSHATDTRVTEAGKGALEWELSHGPTDRELPRLERTQPPSPRHYQESVGCAQTSPLSSFSTHPANYSALHKYPILTPSPNAFHFFHPSHPLKLPSSPCGRGSKVQTRLSSTSP